jgi:mono/diheme cytochrome c family protein
MRRHLWVISAISVILAAGAGTWALTSPSLFTSATAGGVSNAAGDAARGKLVFAAGDCAACHASPGQADRFQLGGGLALASPYGTFRAPNISMDPVDGIGRWTTKDLANALLRGVSPDGRHYYPVFPYPSFTHMRPEDVQDLMAYLRTLPAVRGRTPDHELNPVFGIRRFVGFWKLLYFKPGPILVDTRHDETWNRGRYLSEALAHCAECHSSRDLFGGIKPETRYAGGKDPGGTGFYPNITPARIGDWSEQQVAEMLHTGNTPNHGRVGSSMADVVSNTAMLPDSDREAIAVYLKSLPPRPTPRP